jgi:hypothetical protein
MPFILMWVNLTGIPVQITVLPQQVPTITQIAPQIKSSLDEPAGCRYLVCKA